MQNSSLPNCRKCTAKTICHKDKIDFFVEKYGFHFILLLLLYLLEMKQEVQGTMNHCMMPFSLYEIRNSLLSMTVLKMPGNKLYANSVMLEMERMRVFVITGYV